jgi:hypothetical protein
MTGSRYVYVTLERMEQVSSGDGTSYEANVVREVAWPGIIENTRRTSDCFGRNGLGDIAGMIKPASVSRLIRVQMTEPPGISESGLFKAANGHTSK